MNEAIRILTENATTFADRNKITALMESEVKAVNTSMISNLYKSAISKAHIDFDNIPDSKGNITRYSGYHSMVSSLEIIRDLAKKNNVNVPELEIVEQAIANITTYHDLFEKGFRLEKEFVVLQYNTLVYACVEATSILISSYVDFVKRPDALEFTVHKSSHRGGRAVIDNLEKFNISVKKGDFAKVLNGVINSGKENLTGVEAFAVPALIIGAVLVVVPIIRELVFTFYHSRMKLADFLEHQAAMIEIHKQTVSSSSRPAPEKKAIMDKQSRSIEKLRTLSDKIKVNVGLTDSNVAIELKKENKAWTIDSVQSQAANQGLQLF